MKFMIVALLLSISTAQLSAQNLQCGFKPFKPLGCKNAMAQCVCDAQGHNCHWIWTCS